MSINKFFIDETKKGQTQNIQKNRTKNFLKTSSSTGIIIENNLHKAPTHKDIAI